MKGFKSFSLFFVLLFSSFLQAGSGADKYNMTNLDWLALRVSGLNTVGPGSYVSMHMNGYVVVSTEPPNELVFTTQYTVPIDEMTDNGKQTLMEHSLNLSQVAEALAESKGWEWLQVKHSLIP